ncbi:hypothetical protein N752_12225 [Desulforamulus aquiferis]|nr:hypothetical protein N752_12225 [Desulforamulus aquiferis]
MKNYVWKNNVFLVSAIIVMMLVLLGAVLPNRFGEIAGRLFRFTTYNFGWFYLISVFIIIIFLIALAISKYGTIRLGEEGEKPQFPFFTWIGMLFSAGFGVGLVFWGVAEPMSHFFTTPFSGTEPQTEAAARIAWGMLFFTGESANGLFSQ